jgi:bifunctional DNase/RNase
VCLGAFTPLVYHLSDARMGARASTAWYDTSWVSANEALCPCGGTRAHPKEPAVIVGHVLKRLVRGMAVGIVRRWVTSLLVVGLIAGAVYGLAAQGVLQIPGLSPESNAVAGSLTSTDVREMVVQEIRPVQSRSGELERIDLILREKSGNRRLVMAVGQSEAMAIFADLSALQSRAKPKIDSPTSYDLMRSLVQELGGTVNRVIVNSVTNETFYAKVIMSMDNRQVEVDSRPSDAIALALRARVPIFADSRVLDKAGVSGGS